MFEVPMPRGLHLSRYLLWRHPHQSSQHRPCLQWYLLDHNPLCLDRHFLTRCTKHMSTQTPDHRDSIPTPIGMPGQAPMIVEGTITIDQPIPVLPTPSIRVPQHEQLPALQPFGGHHDVFTPRPDLTSLPLYLPAAFDNQRLLRQDAPYQVPAQIMAEMMRWLQPTTTQDGVQMRMTPLAGSTCGWTYAPDRARILSPVPTAPGACPGPPSAIRYQLCTSICYTWFCLSEYRLHLPKFVSCYSLRHTSVTFS